MRVLFGGGFGGGENCTLIVANTIAFQGGVVMNNDPTACLQAGVTAGIQQTRVRIME